MASVKSWAPMLRQAFGRDPQPKQPLANMVLGKPKAPKPPKPPTPVTYSAPSPDQSWKDSAYYGNESTIQGGLDNLKPYLINQAQGLGSSYGVNLKNTDPTNGADPGASVDWTNVDTTNPFSRAALLKQSYTQQSSGDGNRMAAAGQLYSGAYQNAQNADTKNYTQGQNSLLTDFAQKYGGLYGQWQNANQTATGQRITNQGNSIASHLNDPAVPVQTRTLTVDQYRSAGITPGAGKNGELVWRDRSGNIIPGVSVWVKNGKTGITVPA